MTTKSPFFRLWLPSLLVVWGATSAAAADRCCWESRIKFLDDLCCPCARVGWEDPFEERIETDRHDFTQSTKTVGRGVVQLEAGYTYFYLDEHEEIEQSHTTPELMARIGLTEDIELRLRWTYAWRFIDVHDDVDSAEDLRWAFKLDVTDQACWVPDSALEIRFTAPTGGSAWTTERVEFGLDYIYGWKLTEKLELAASTALSTNGLDDFGLLPEEPASDRFMLWSQSLAVGRELTEHTTLYVEYFGLFSYALEDDFTMHFVNTGVDFFLTHNFVLDVRAGMGLSPDADDLFLGVGGGYRF
jgi:hypothetical protein